MGIAHQSYDTYQRTSQHAGMAGQTSAAAEANRGVAERDMANVEVRRLPRVGGICEGSLFYSGRVARYHIFRDEDNALYRKSMIG